MAAGTYMPMYLCVPSLDVLQVQSTPHVLRCRIKTRMAREADYLVVHVSIVKDPWGLLGVM